MKLEKKIINKIAYWFGPKRAIYSMIPSRDNYCFNYFLAFYIKLYFYYFSNSIIYLFFH